MLIPRLSDNTNNRSDDAVAVSESCTITGVSLTRLAPVADMRGSLCEIYRDNWHLAPRAVQWDFVSTKATMLRGVHVHQLRFDYLIVVAGQATIGLADIRRDASSFRRSMTVETRASDPCLIVIPPGVAHGIYAHQELSYLYGLTEPWDGHDEELGCRYDDPGAGIPWPDFNAILLE